MAKGDIQVSVYLDPAVHKRVASRAREEDRAVSKMVGRLVREALDRPVAARPSVKDAWPAPVVDRPINQLGAFSAPKSDVTPPAKDQDRVQRSATVHNLGQPQPDIWVCHKCFGVNPEGENCGCGESPREPEPEAEEEEIEDDGWDPNGEVSAEPPAERVTPATHTNIPRDWVNEYGLTLEQQNAIGAEDTLEYGPPGRRVAQ
jgi:hypothetical protein